VVFADTLGTDASDLLIQAGDKVSFSGASDDDYNIEAVITSVSTTNTTNDTVTFNGRIVKQETSTADTGIVAATLIRQDRFARYRELIVYPASSDTRTTLRVEGIIEAQPLQEDDDEPLIPIEDRDVLLYGALSRQWIKTEDLELFNVNRAEFEQKFKEMVGGIEDSREIPQLKPNTIYLRQLRGTNRNRGSGLDTGIDSFGTGGGASVITGTADRVTVFDANGKLGSSDITTTELDYLDGTTSNIQTQIDSKLGGSGTQVDNTVVRWDGTGGTSIQGSGIVIDDSNAVTGITSLTVDNLVVNGNAITSSSGDIDLTPTGDVKVSTLTSGRVLIAGASGALADEAQLAASRGGTGVDPSGSTGVPTISAGTWSVSAQLPIAQGGTAGATAQAGFDNLSPTTTKGDLTVNDGTNNIRVGVGSNNQVLIADSGETSGVRWGATPASALTVTSVTDAYTVATSDDVVLCNSTTDFTLTLPAASGNSGVLFRIKNINTNIVTVDGDGSETIDGATDLSLSDQYESVTVVCDGTEWWVV
jgi:hypothetical protein